MQKKWSSSSIEEVAGCIDILSKILLLLPLKHLARLQCVSKQWLTLISDQRFRELHSLLYHPAPTSLIFTNKHGPLVLLPLSFTTTTTTTPTFGVLNLNFLNQSKLTVVRSCNGFLLCHGGTTYFICNPITLDFTTFTLSNHPFKDCEKMIYLYLAFDPSISPSYQVISVALSSLFREYIFNVYSFEDCSWNSPAVRFSSPFALDADGVFCNRAIYWCNNAEFSVYFDIDTHRLRNWRMPLSDSEWQDRCINYFGETRGCLHLVIDVYQQTPIFDIFERKEDYSGWLLKHRVDLSRLGDEFPELDFWPYSLGLYIVRLTKEDMILLFIWVEETRTFIIYDPINSRMLCDFKTGIMPADQIYNSLLSGGIFQYSENTALVEA